MLTLVRLKHWYQALLYGPSLIQQFSSYHLVEYVYL